MNRDDWPDDSPTHVFLARVVLFVGEGIFGAQWTGEEPALELITPLPEQYHASIGQDDLLRACRALYDYCPAYRDACSPADEYTLHWPMPNQEQWMFAVKLFKEAAEERRADFGRFIDVSQRLSHDFKHGFIQTALRPFGGGAERPQERTFWNTEAMWPRFCTCQVDAGDPFKAELVATGGDYIFVDRASLNKALEPPQPEPRTPDQARIEHAGYMSPYLRCMIEATRGLMITRDDPRKKEELIPLIRKFWPGDPDALTDADLAKMATFLRGPEFKKGRANKSKRPR